MQAIDLPAGVRGGSYGQGHLDNTSIRVSTFSLSFFRPFFFFFLLSSSSRKIRRPAPRDLILLATGSLGPRPVAILLAIVCSMAHPADMKRKRNEAYKTLVCCYFAGLFLAE